MGLISMDLGEGETEFLHLEYAKDTKLYVPVAQLHVISRYSGAAPEDAPLHALGSGQWEKAKRKAAAAGARHRGRTAQPVCPPRRAPGPCLPVFGARLRSLRRELRLRGNARPGRRDQRRDRGHDLRASRWTGWSAATSASARPKSRCAPPSSPCMGGKQVAILAPTTLLAEQHAQTFADRFADWPVRIAELSRFRTGKEVDAGDQGHGRRHGRYRDRHPQAAVAATSSSSAWAWSSSTRNTASACARRKR